MKTELERFTEKVAEDDLSGCWNWTGAKCEEGYGRFRYNNKHSRPHRWSYEHFIGTISNGLVIDHLCRNPACVNPEHLEPVTDRVNILRGDGPCAVNARKTHCIHGHEFKGNNMIIRKDRKGTRECRECLRRRLREYRKRKSRLGKAAREVNSI